MTKYIICFLTFYKLDFLLNILYTHFSTAMYFIILNLKNYMQIEEMFNDYAKIKLEISLLEKKLEKLKEPILEYLIENGGKVEHTLGNFTTTTRKLYTYPDYIEAQREAVKVAEKQAISNNEVEVTETKSLMFKQITI